MNFNKLILGGRITRDPESRSTNAGKTVCSITVAVNHKYVVDGTVKESVTFVDCDVWGRRGEAVAQYLKRGDPILVEGRLSQDEWEDKKTGQKRSKLFMTVERFEFVSTKNEGGSGRRSGGQSRGQSRGSGEPAGYDEVPF